MYSQIKFTLLQQLQVCAYEVLHINPYKLQYEDEDVFPRMLRWRSENRVCVTSSLFSNYMEVIVHVRDEEICKLIVQDDVSLMNTIGRVVDQPKRYDPFSNQFSPSQRDHPKLRYGQTSNQNFQAHELNKSAPPPNQGIFRGYC